MLTGGLTTTYAIGNYSNNNYPTIKHSSTEPEIKYVVKDYKGRIAVFYNNNQIPIEIYDIYTDTLPEEDVKKIKAGITLNQKELEGFINDYTS